MDWEAHAPHFPRPPNDDQPMTLRRRAILVVMVASVAGLWTGFYRFGIRDEWIWVGWGALLVFYEWVFLW